MKPINSEINPEQRARLRALFDKFSASALDLSEAWEEIDGATFCPDYPAYMPDFAEFALNMLTWAQTSRGILDGDNCPRCGLELDTDAAGKACALCGIAGVIPDKCPDGTGCDTMNGGEVELCNRCEELPRFCICVGGISERTIDDLYEARRLTEHAQPHIQAWISGGRLCMGTAHTLDDEGHEVE